MRSVLAEMVGKGALPEIYERIANGAPEKLRANPHWKDKIRQVLNQHPQIFHAPQRGEWALA